MKSRAYRQQARALSTAETRTAILDAVDEIFLPRPGRMFSLEEVAERAGTTVQTVLRHFGSKAGLLEEACRRGLAKVRVRRDEVPVGDLGAIAAYLGRHYKETSAMVLRMLAVEEEVPEVARIAQQGRDMHRAWVERVFAPLLKQSAVGERHRRRATLIAVTDLLTWKVLTLEQGLSQRDYERSVLELLEAFR
jgi:AcrR family transcriptional regulator